MRGEYTDAAWGTLEAGEVVTSHVETGSRGTGDAGQVVASVFVERPPEPIWSVLLDFSRHPEFLPNVHETRVRRWDGQRVWIQQHLRVFLTDIRYGAIWRLDPPRGRAHFALDEDVPHDIAASHGSWELVPTPDRRRTLLRYSAEVDTGRPLPAVVERMLTQRSLPRVVRGLRDAVHERFPRAPLDASREATPP